MKEIHCRKVYHLYGLWAQIEINKIDTFFNISETGVIQTKNGYFRKRTTHSLIDNWYLGHNVIFPLLFRKPNIISRKAAIDKNISFAFIPFTIHIAKSSKNRIYRQSIL